MRFFNNLRIGTRLGGAFGLLLLLALLGQALLALHDAELAGDRLVHQAGRLAELVGRFQLVSPAPAQA